MRILVGFLPLGSLTFFTMTSCNDSDKDLSLNSPLFSTKEWKLMTRLVDIIIPKTDTPSASEVNAPERIEDLLLNSYSAKLRSTFKNGLQFIENQCLALYNAPSAKCTENEIRSILNFIIENNNKGTEMDLYPFYPMLKGLTVTAFFTSKEMTAFFEKEKEQYII